MCKLDVRVGQMSFADTFVNWMEAHILDAPEMAAFGFAMAVGLLIMLAVLLIRAFMEFFARLKSAGLARSVRRDKMPGYRIMLANAAGRKSGRATRFLSEALEDHFATFSFGAPYRLIKSTTITGGRSPQAVRLARRRLAASDADMIVWADRTSSGEEGLQVYGLSRGGGLRADEAGVFAFSLTGKPADWTDAIKSAAAFKLARELQPALKHPESFRGEKMKDLASALESMIAPDAPLSAALRAELEADFCACAVHVAEDADEPVWLDRVIDLRRTALSDPSYANNRQGAIQARIDLGRALLIKAEKKYDQAILQEAINHLGAVVTALQSDPAISRARSASEAMYKAQAMIENRKRFSLNFGS